MSDSLSARVSRWNGDLLLKLYTRGTFGLDFLAACAVFILLKGLLDLGYMYFTVLLFSFKPRWMEVYIFVSNHNRSPNRRAAT